MSTEVQQIETSIAALEAQRALLGDAVVDVAVAGLLAKLAALERESALPEQRLKQVSILFLDVVGSTTLSQRLDPEAISAVMDDALARGTAIVQAHDGRVLQYAGDNILAAFGADGAREDDAERAVRCGLDLLALGRQLGAEVLARHGHDGIDVRLGIHTGAVLLGGGVDAQGSIRGIAVNIAARMEQTAPSGALRISQDCYSQVRGLFVVEAQPPLVVKGIDAPMQSYLVLRERARSFRLGTRGIEGVATRMIGRDTELGQLQQAFKCLFAERRLAAVTVVAEAGVGKSRLRHEFESWVDAQSERLILFPGRANPHTQNQPFGLLRHLLVRHFQIADDDSIAAARAKLEAAITALFVDDAGPDLAEAHAHLLGHLIGIDYRDSRHIKHVLNDPQQLRNRALHTASQVFRRLSHRGNQGDGAHGNTPVLLALEDLHWADAETLDFLHQLSDVNRDVAMLILSFSRPSVFERRSELFAPAAAHQVIRLQTLGPEGGLALAHELLQNMQPIPESLSALLTSRAEGNPFFMEEMVKMMIDQGAISCRPEGWLLNAERLKANEVPLTLTGVLQARLDSLPATERLTLQVASVIGHVFWDQALFTLDEHAPKTLPELVRRESVLPKPADQSPADEDQDALQEFAFRHQLLQQVTESTVLKQNKRRLHAGLAHWLSGVTGLRANDFLALTAEHYERAGDPLNAVEFHARAAEHARQRLAHETVLSHVRRALALLDQESAAHAPLRWRLGEALQFTLDTLGQRAEQREVLLELERLAEALDDDDRRAEVAILNSAFGMRTADHSMHEQWARQGMTLAERTGNDNARLRSQRLLSLACYYQGKLDQAAALAEESLHQARALGLRRREAECLNALFMAKLSMDVKSALRVEWQIQALTILRELGDQRGAAIMLGNLGNFWKDLGQFEQAQKALDESLQVARQSGDRQQECYALSVLADVALMRGQTGQSIELARNSLALAKDVGARHVQCWALRCLGRVEMAQMNYPAAEQAFAQEQALSLAMDGFDQYDGAAGRAELALAQGDAQAALQHMEGFLAIAMDSGNEPSPNDPHWVGAICHRALSAAQDARAGPWLKHAHGRLQASAERIDDAELRAGFLTNIPYHREITRAWEAAQ